MNILITAFGPFNNFSINPSETVLEKLKEHVKIYHNIHFEWKVLDVSYNEIDNFILNKKSHHDLIIHLGVATNSLKMRLEIKAQNLKCGNDIFNINPINEKIIENNHSIYTSFPSEIINKIIFNKNLQVVYSDDAGTYLCNYLYFKSLKNFSSKSHILFVHIADFQSELNAVSLENQVLTLIELLDNYCVLVNKENV
jgi:pyroglutamyl-peptidase